MVAWDTINKKLLPFQVLSTRKRKAEESEEQAVQVIVQGFDLIYLHGESLLRKPLVLRRAMMHAAFKEVGCCCCCFLTCACDDVLLLTLLILASIP